MNPPIAACKELKLKFHTDWTKKRIERCFGEFHRKPFFDPNRMAIFGCLANGETLTILTLD
jgi:hypothetical protein